MRFSISNLRDRPEFFPAVADRVWDFTWKAKGVPLADVSAGLTELISKETFPFVIVAHDGERYVGSTLAIVSDMDERPEYTPWVAAVWVDPEYRGQNVGRSLVSHAAGSLLRTFPKIYLCAVAARHDFYAQQGWVPIERNVGEKQLTIFSKQNPAA
jgi:predicted N-acetyltransferase YhbS